MKVRTLAGYFAYGFYVKGMEGISKMAAYLQNRLGFDDARVGHPHDPIKRLRKLVLWIPGSRTASPARAYVYPSVLGDAEPCVVVVSCELMYCADKFDTAPVQVGIDGQGVLFTDAMNNFYRWITATNIEEVFSVHPKWMLGVFDRTVETEHVSDSGIYVE